MGNGDDDVRGLDQQLHVAQPQGLAHCQRGVFDALVVEVGAVGRVAVAHRDALLGEHDLTMSSRDGVMFDPEVIVQTAAQAVQTPGAVRSLGFRFRSL